MKIKDFFRVPLFVLSITVVSISFIMVLSMTFQLYAMSNETETFFNEHAAIQEQKDMAYIKRLFQNP